MISCCGLSVLILEFGVVEGEAATPEVLFDQRLSAAGGVVNISSKVLNSEVKMRAEWVIGG